MNTENLTIENALARIPDPPEKQTVGLFSHGSLLIKMYSPKDHDAQKPHEQDEVYVIARGSGWFVNGDSRHRFEPGQVLFVPAGVVHRFEDFSDDFATWVMFYGPKGGETETIEQEPILKNTGLTVCKPGMQDHAQWQSLYHGYAEFYKKPMNAGILDTVWGWIQDEQNPFYCIVAKDEHCTLLGLMHFRAMPSPLRGVMVGFLDDLFVSSEVRGKGVVNALYAGLEEKGRELGWPFIRWITADDNYRARSVYDQLSTRTHWVTYQLDL